MIDILIPTFNRCSSLLANLRHLETEIIGSDYSNLIRVVISDNASNDGTEQAVIKFKKKSDLRITYSRNDENIGLEANMVKISAMADSPYSLFLGDDDFLAEGYIDFCLSYLRENQRVGLIIPGLGNLYASGKFEPGRIESFKKLEIEPSYYSALKFSHFGHQLSGLVFKGRKFLDFYLSHEGNRNIYPFINFVCYQLIHYPALYVPHFKTKISVDNQKDWSYNDVALLDEVFKAYLPFRQFYKENQVADLMIQFIRMHSYRLDFSMGLRKNFRLITKAAPKISSFKRKLFILLMKEYIIRKVRFH